MQPPNGNSSINRPNVPDNKRLDSGKSLALDSTGTTECCSYLDDCAPDESAPGILETHASGTNIEGDFEVILAATRQIHEVLHVEGSTRLVSYLKLETRTDKEPTLAGKRLQQ